LSHRSELARGMHPYQVKTDWAIDRPTEEDRNAQSGEKGNKGTVALGRCQPVDSLVCKSNGG